VDLADGAFRLSETPPAEALVSSVRLLGLLSPPLLREREDSRFQILDGFKRVEACRLADMESIPALILDKDASPDFCAMAAVAANASSRPLTLLETSRAIRLLAPDKPWEERREVIRRVLGLEGGEGYVQDIESLSRLPETVQKAVEADAVALPVALRLRDMEDKDAEAVARLFLRLPQSLSRQRQVVDLVAQIGQREGLSPAQVLEDPDIRRAMEEEGDRNAAGAKVRSILYRRRYPVMAEETEKRKQTLSELCLPPRITWHPPPHFEGLTHSLRMDFDSADELSNHLDRLRRLLDHPALKKLLP